MSGRNYIGIIVFAFIILALSYINYFTAIASNYGDTLLKLIQASVIIMLAYLVNSLIENIIGKQVHDTKNRYTLRKVVSVIITLLAAGAIMIVFLKETTTLIVAYGILSAGVVITLQDVFRSFAGGIVILFSRTFQAGDRIQVGDCYGDVLDINYFHTTLMEIREWVDGDQYTGRILTMPNSFVLDSTVKNYTRDFSFIWDEVTIILSPESDWKKSRDIALQTTNSLIEDYVEHSKKELASMERKYMFTSYDVDTKIFLFVESDRIEMHLRYVVDTKQRRYVNDLLTQGLLDAFATEPDIIIGSISSIEITKMP
ncbi:small-conductance mechanosensitive channel [Methanolobus tindarius DSM 2278]|uniref:Small-conductance mechanosensitive channel n=1 Tax=Methanolobus tindarius DSM 2278 TaxID=1090322 RepID=W9DNI1_METTI|nr:mechanosensitive ion channel domain-containing protein [Methanolobus tindarius]ETA67639.1 small-conductance mechanosensitive channel [Methanolobus tindarius DSM 2278]